MKRRMIGKMTRQAMGSQKRGFTLVELLIVMAIVSLLAAMLLPVLAKAIEMGRRAACLNNEKQLGLTAILYSDDYGCLPKRGGHYWEWKPGVDKYTYYNTAHLLYTVYMKDPMVVRCPSMSGRFASNAITRQTAIWMATNGIIPYWAMGFSSSVCLDTASWNVQAAYYLRIDKFRNPRQALLQDAAMNSEPCSSGWSQYYMGNHALPTKSYRAAGGNVITMSLSARWIEITDIQWYGGWQKAGQDGGGGGNSGLGCALLAPDSTAICRQWSCYRGLNILYPGGDPRNGPLLGSYGPSY